MGVFASGLFYIFIYMPLFFLYTFIQRLYWFCNGMGDIVNQIEEGQLYDRSAQVFDVVWKCKKEPFQLVSHRNFIGTHRSFEHPNYVLRHNVSLLAVEMDLALFVEVPNDYDIFDCRKSPFIHIGQFEQAVKFIILPISSFVRCAEELGDPKMKVIWLHSTGRCGSTAMSQVFEAVPNCTTESEPMCLFTARNEAAQAFGTKKFRQYLNSEDYKQSFIATVRMMCKPNEHNPDILFIKNCTLSGVMDVPSLEEYFPDHTNLFLYRDCLDTVQSYIRSLNKHFFLNLILKMRESAITRFLIRSPHVLLKTLAAPHTLETHQWLSDSKLQLEATKFGLLVIQWGCYCSHYTEMVTTTKSNVRAILYEDIVEHKHATLTLLFQFCGISLDYVELAKKSLESDSQEGTVLSMSNLGKFKKTHITEELRTEGNFYLNAFKLKPLGQRTHLPKALSPSADEHSGDITQSNGHVAITIHT